MKSIILTIFLLTILLQTNSFATTNNLTQQKVYFLSSYSVGREMPPMLLSILDGQERMLHEEMREFFEPLGYEVVTKGQANQFDLYQAVSDPLAVGVLWIGHATGSTEAQGNTAVATGRGRLEGAEGTDMSHILQAIHPNLGFLGIGGCSSEQGLEEILSRFDIRSKNPHLDAVGMSKEVDPLTAFQTIIRRMDSSLVRLRNSYRAQSCRVARSQTQEYLKVRVKRRSDFQGSYSSSVSLKRQNLLGVLAKATTAGRISKIIKIPKEAIGRLNSRNLSLVVDSGVPLTFADLEPGDLGEIQFELILPNGQVIRPWRYNELFSANSGLFYGWTHSEAPTDDYFHSEPLTQYLNCQDMPLVRQTGQRKALPDFQLDTNPFLIPEGVL